MKEHQRNAKGKSTTEIKNEEKLILYNFPTISKICLRNGKQTINPEKPSDLGLHCLLKPICPKTENFYGISE